MLFEEAQGLEENTTPGSRKALLGIEVLRGPDSFNYVVHHVFALYREVFRGVNVVFCALDAPDLHERFPTPLPRSEE